MLNAMGRMVSQSSGGSFFAVRKYEQRDHGEFRTKRLALDVFDTMTKAIETGEP